MPWLEKVHERYGEDELRIVGLTRVTRTATDEWVRRFIRENGITYPMVKENGAARQYFKMPGTPFMIVVRDGRLLWEHQLLTEQFPEHLIRMIIAAAD